MSKAALDSFRGYLNAHSAAERPFSKAIGLPVVTISRQTGAGSGPVAELLAQRLNTGRNPRPWTIFDRNLVEQILEDHHLPDAIKRFMPEDALRFSTGSVVEELLGLHPSSWTLVQHSTETIMRLARMGNVILIGRGGNVITATMRNAFHVRLVAPEDFRIRRIAEIDGLSLEDATAHVHKHDAARSRYVRNHFKSDSHDPLQYHAVFNTGWLGFEETARLIAEALSRYLSGT